MTLLDHRARPIAPRTSVDSAARLLDSVVSAAHVAAAASIDTMNEARWSPSYAHVAAAVAATDARQINLRDLAGVAQRAAQKRAYRYASDVAEVLDARRIVGNLVASVPLQAQQTNRVVLANGRLGRTTLDTSELQQAHDWVDGFGLEWVDGGQAELARRFAEELFVGGEVIVVGWTDNKGAGHYDAIAPLAIKVIKDAKNGDAWLVEDGSRDPIVIPLETATATTVVCGQPGAHRGQPWSGVMAAIRACGTLHMIDRLLDIIAKVSLSPGLLMIPDTIAPPPVATTPNGAAPSPLDYFVATLDDAIASVVTTSSARELLPVPVTAPPETIAQFRHLLFERKYDAQLLPIREQVAARVRDFLDVERRAVDGSVVQSKYVNGELVAESMLTNYIQPFCARLGNVATGHMRAWLAMLGIDAANQVVTPDLTALQPAPSFGDVLAAFQAGAVSSYAVRDVMRAPEDWAPEPADLMPADSTPPEQLAPAPAQAPVLIPATSTPEMPEVAPAVSAAIASPVGNRATQRLLGKINAIDSGLAARIGELLAITAADAAAAVARRATDRKSRSKEHDALAPVLLTTSVLGGLGVDVDGAIAAQIDKASPRVRSALVSAMTEAMVLLAEDGEDDTEIADDDPNVEAALSLFGASVRGEVLRQLAAISSIDEFETEAIAAPSGLARTISQLAGGSPGILAAVGGLLGSTLIIDGLTAAGIDYTYQWQHSGATNEFAPHADLDGVQFGGWDDPALATAGTGYEWVGESFSPTDGPDGPDHTGCGCTVLLTAGGGE